MSLDLLYRGYNSLGGGFLSKVKKKGVLSEKKPLNESQDISSVILSSAQAFQEEADEMVTVADDSPDKQRLVALSTRLRLASEEVDGDPHSAVKSLLADLKADYRDFTTRPFYQSLIQNLEMLDDGTEDQPSERPVADVSGSDLEPAPEGSDEEPLEGEEGEPEVEGEEFDDIVDSLTK